MRTIFKKFLYPLGLRKHALVVSGSLLFLTVLLGTRAYSVARTHYQEISDLVNHDVKAEGLLIRMESLANSRDQARRKLRITRDRAYAQLVSHHDDNLQSTSVILEQTLQGAYPALATQVKKLRNAADVRAMRDELNTQREAKLTHAREAARGLLSLILIALVLSIAIMTWLVHLFYAGLIDPLTTLKEATSRIRAGELSYRIPSADEGVTELRELSVSFNAMAEKLEALDNSKTEFLATISHEVKNPLAALKEGLNLLATHGDNLPPHSRGKAFAACVIASKRLEFMINNMLHHSRMEAGLYKFDLTLKNLSAAIQTAVDEVRPMADRKGMSIQLNAPSELEASFNWDGMVQVFENLLLNAIKYGTENSPIEINTQITQRQMKRKSTASQTVPHVEVSVVNSGAKIQETEVPRLFDRFYRAGNSGQQQGLGLGLHVVKKIIEAHHGEVAASSSATAGEAAKTRIQLWIPGRYETEAIS